MWFPAVVLLALKLGGALLRIAGHLTKARRIGWRRWFREKPEEAVVLAAAIVAALVLALELVLAVMG